MTVDHSKRSAVGIKSAGPRTALRIVKILRFIAERPQGASLAQLSQGLSAPKTSLFSLLRVLTDNDYLSYDAGKYQLSNAAFVLGSAIIGRRHFPEVALPIMRALAAKAGESVFISELLVEEALAIYTARAESVNPFRFMASIGDCRPLYASSGGRVLLAFQRAEWRERYLAEVDLVAYTPHTIIDRQELRAMLSTIQTTNLARTRDDLHEGVSAFAAPIRDRSGHVIAAIALASTTARADQCQEQFSRLVRAAAMEISAVLGFNAERDPNWGPALVAQ